MLRDYVSLEVNYWPTTCFVIDLVWLLSNQTVKRIKRLLCARLGAFRPADWSVQGRCPISIPKDSKILRYLNE